MYLLTYYRCLPEINVYRPNMQQLYPKNQQFVLLFQARMTSILFYPSSIWRIFDQASKLIIDKHERFFRSGSRKFCINCFLVHSDWICVKASRSRLWCICSLHTYANNAAQNATVHNNSLGQVIKIARRSKKCKLYVLAMLPLKPIIHLCWLWLHISKKFVSSP